MRVWPLLLLLAAMPAVAAPRGHGAVAAKKPAVALHEPRRPAPQARHGGPLPREHRAVSPRRLHLAVPRSTARRFAPLRRRESIQDRALRLVSGSTFRAEQEGGTYLMYFDPSGTARFRAPDGARTEHRWSVRSGLLCFSLPEGERCARLESGPDGATALIAAGQPALRGHLLPGNPDEL